MVIIADFVMFTSIIYTKQSIFGNKMLDLLHGASP